MKLKREAAKRRKPNKEMSVTKSSTGDYLRDGWTVDRELKTKNRIRKPWSHDERLENRVWHLFFLLGYPEISGGRNFQITIKRRGADTYRKQIDVLAKDDETVVVAECKSSERTTRRSLQKDIEEFANLKGPISTAIRKYYGPDFKPKIIWMFFTNNIIWSQPDQQRAKGANIKVVNERDLAYYVQIAEPSTFGGQVSVLGRVSWQSENPGDGERQRTSRERKDRRQDVLFVRINTSANAQDLICKPSVTQ